MSIKNFFSTTLILKFQPRRTRRTRSKIRISGFDAGNSNFGICRGNHGELPCSFYKSGKYLPIIGDFKGGRGGSPCPPL